MNRSLQLWPMLRPARLQAAPAELRKKLLLGMLAVLLP